MQLLQIQEFRLRLSHSRLLGIAEHQACHPDRIVPNPRMAAVIVPIN
jgi:hypothetical protein